MISSLGFSKNTFSERKCEILLFGICAALAVLLHCVVGFKMVVLNLFFLPVVLASFFLGRQRAAVLALICVLFASVDAVCNLEDFASSTSPAVIGLSIIVWAAVMGLNSIFVGTLSDERANTIAELHDAYLGVIDVLAQYLKSADPEMSDRSLRISSMSQELARRIRLSERQVDDIRVAALLQDIRNIEVTAKVIRRAVGDMTTKPTTFQGSDLVHSLGTVLTGALPLIVDEPIECIEQQKVTSFPGALIIRTATRYDELVHGTNSVAPQEALSHLRLEFDAFENTIVLHALEQIVNTNASSQYSRELQAV